MNILPSFKPSPHVTSGTQFAKDVVSGEIPMCQWVRFACQRHLDDLERVNSPYYFDVAEAEKWCKYLELLPHTKGKWARLRMTLDLEAWQCFKTMCIFGWRRRSDKLRRFRKVFILEPRKNAKSTWAAGVGLGMFTIDGEFGAEVYSGATTEKQAWEVFKPARLMAMRTKALMKRFGIHVMTSNLSRLADESKFEPMIGNPGDGSSPSCAIVDEYHEHQNDNMVDTMLTGMGARDQPLMLIITTAGDNLAGPCYAYQQYVQRVLAGVMDDDELFGMIFTIDKGVQWDSVEALRMANPNMGVSVSEEFLISQQKTAINDPRKAGIFKTKHLNIWVAAKDAYYNVARWQEAEQVGVQISDFYDQPVRIGLDLASKHDITAKIYLFRLDECNCDTASRLIEEGYEYAMFGEYYLPSETYESPENEHYHGWKDYLTVTEGEAVDYVKLRNDITGYTDEVTQEYTKGDIDNFQLEEVAFDPHQARMLVSELMAEGVECVEVRPLVINFSEPMKESDALIRRRALAHNGDPVFTWMLSCVIAKLDEKDNVYPNKDKSQKQNKIDGPVALIMVLARWMSVEDTRSVYEDRGILMV